MSSEFMFDSIEHEIAYRALDKQLADMLVENGTEASVHLQRIIATKDNYAERPLASATTVKQKILNVIKRTIRKSLRWYIDPYVHQQVYFNNEMTATISILAQSWTQMSDYHERLYSRQQTIERRLIAHEISNQTPLNTKDIDTMFTILSAQTRELNAKLSETDIYGHINNLVEMYQELSLKVTNIRKDEINYKLDDIYGHINNLVEIYQSLSKNPSSIPFNLANKTTYSQSGEDAILAYILIMLGYNISEITYLDLGANDPIEINNTYLFYSLGSAGCLVEANLNLIPKLRAERPRDTILNLAVDSKQQVESIPFYIMNVSSMSTTNYEMALSDVQKNPQLEIIETIQVKVATINTIIKEYMDNKAPIILNIDVEGNSIQLLKSIDFVQYRPVLIVLEMIDYGVLLMHHSKNNDLLEYLEQVNYEEYAFTGINSIFVDRNILNK